MTIPVHSIQIEEERQAVAPYNFVPLPEKMVEAETPPTQDIFHPELLTGYVDLEIESCSPVYIRGMYTTKQYERLGNKKSGDLTPEEKLERAPFYAIQQQPALPGSSLRGMLRELVEIVSSGRMRWVSKSPTFTYRAVADESDDPLKRKYKDIFGGMAKNVRTGYLVFEHGSWYVQPAQTTDKAGLGRKEYFLKVYEEDITVSGYIPMSDANYRPQVTEVRFQQNGFIKKSDALIEKARQKNKNKKGPTKPDIKEDRVRYLIQSKDQKLSLSGWLVTSGNMRETGGKTSVRDKNYIFMPVDEKATRLSIPEQVVEDYRAGLTPYQIEKLTDWRDGNHDESWGCLGHGKPVFYIPNKDNPKTVQYFGHNPNFRIPVMLDGENRAANPLDFVPDFLRNNPNPDMADAIFGWTEEWDEKSADDQTSRVRVGPAKQRAGRVFFSDALYAGNTNGIWYNNGEPITPKILSNPKPTTFQHYLLQDKDKGHDPNQKESLAHYGTPPSQTGIRGYKFYWHKGNAPQIKYEAKSPDKKHPENVLTRISPIKSGVRFTSKIHFENLRPEELGVLCWVLMLQGKHGKTYRHKIGMGKPLGMGAVKITLNNVHLSLRKDADEQTRGRYGKLIDGNTWFAPKTSMKTPEKFILDFENFMQKHEVLSENQKLSDNARIQDLLELLQWRGDTVEEKVIEVTRYMEIEHPIKDNEYKDRPVLPAPKKVFEGWFKEQMDVKKMAEDMKKRATSPAQFTAKDASELKPGNKVKCLVVSVEDKGRGRVHFEGEKYGKDVDFVLPVEEKVSQDRYLPQKSKHQLEVVRVEQVKKTHGKWIVYCKKP